MTTTHTPGPWHVTTWPGDADVPEGCSLGIDDEDGAAGGRDYFLATVVHGDPDELRANARLIAAAPDLLAALAELVGALEADAMDDKSNVYRSMMLSANHAIARATGKA